MLTLYQCKILNKEYWEYSIFSTKLLKIVIEVKLDLLIDRYQYRKYYFCIILYYTFKYIQRESILKLK